MKEGSYSGAPSVTEVRVAMATETRRHSRVRLMAILTRCQCEASIDHRSPLSPSPQRTSHSVYLGCAFQHRQTVNFPAAVGKLFAISDPGDKQLKIN